MPECPGSLVVDTTRGTRMYGVRCELVAAGAVVEAYDARHAELVGRAALYVASLPWWGPVTVHEVRQ